MPIYVYKCPYCGSVEEVLARSSYDVRVPICYRSEDCAFKMERVPTAPALRFSGSGWQTPRARE